MEQINSLPNSEPASMAQKEAEKFRDGEVNESDNIDGSSALLSNGNAGGPPLNKGYAWVIVGVSFINMIFAFGSINAFGVFQTYYLVNMFVGVSADKIAWISTMVDFFTLGAGLFAGPLIRKIGLRYSSLLGTTLGTVGLVMASFSTEVWQLVITQGIMFGTGCAIIVNIGLTVPVLWFDRHQSVALGIVTSGGGFGVLVLVPAVTKIISTLGIAWAFRILAIVFFVATGICGYLTIPRTEYKPVNKVFDTKLAKDPVVFLLCLVGVFMEIGYNVPTLYFPSSLVFFGVSESTAANLILVSSISSALGRLTLGYLSKKLGSENMIIASHTLAAIVMMGLWYTSTSLVMSLAFYVLFGLFSVPFFALGPIIIAENYQSDQISQINALASFFSAVSILIGVPSTGLIFEKYGKRKNYQQIIILGTVFYLTSAIAAVWLKIFLKERKGLQTE